MPHKILILNQLRQNPEGGAHALDALIHRQGFPVNQRGNRHHQPDTCHGGKNPVPGTQQQNLAADNRCQNRRQSVDHHQHRIKGSQISPLAHIPGNSTGNDNAADSCQPLNQTGCQKDVYIIYEHTHQRGSHKNQHAQQKRNLPPSQVADRPRKNLPQSHAHHGHGQCQLSHGCCTAKLSLQLR